MLKYQLKPNFEKESVRYLQELLCLLGFAVTIDGDFGPATDHAVKLWREAGGGWRNGSLDNDIYKSDVDVMLNKLGLAQAQDPGLAFVSRYSVTGDLAGAGFGQVAVEVAKYHAQFRPREVGPDNYGPWVRMYMDGQEGLPWCAGFVSTIYKQTEKITGQPRPIPGSWSCTALANQAIGAKRFAKGEDLAGQTIKPGSLFVRRKKRQDGTYFGDAWEHTGIVIEDLPAKNLIKTLEGNTNDNGSREGYEVCEHILRRDNRDYILA